MYTTGVLTESVLVLNKNYIPINVIPLYKAISLLARQRAEIVYIEDGYFYGYNLTSWSGFTEMKMAEGIDEETSIIHGMEKKIMVPKIIRTLFFDKIPNRNIVLTRRNLFLRDGNKCQYCQKQYPSTELNIDHIIPKSKGGKTVWENVVCSCVHCNSKKGSKTLEEAGLKLLHKPSKPKYNLTIFEKSKEPKYKSWRNFLDDAYWNTPLLK